MKYQEIYNQIIERAKNRTLEDYVEKHHIIPKCMDGLDNQSNIVKLTAREHFLCHLLLCEIYPNNGKLWYALFLMSTNRNKKEGQRYKVSSRLYEKIKIEHIPRIKGIKKPEGFGKRLISEERNKKIGVSNSKPKPSNFGENHSLKMKGKKKPEGFSKHLQERVKPINQYDLNNNFIKEWKSQKEAGEKLGLKGIPQCLQGRTTRAGQFKWKYKNES